MSAVYTIRQVSQILGIAEATVRRLVREGDIPSFRPSPRRILVPVASFEKWLAKKVGIDSEP